MKVRIVERLQAAPEPVVDEPFGYFRVQPFGWEDCAESDDGAIALYTRPAADVPSADKSHPWEVREPFTDAVVANFATEAEAHEWIHHASSEYRNGGHIPPSYTVRPAADVLADAATCLDQLANGSLMTDGRNHDHDGLRELADSLPNGYVRSRLLLHADRIDAARAKGGA